MRWVLPLLVCFLAGCPAAHSNPEVVDVVPITSSMSPTEVILVNELNQIRNVKFHSDQERRTAVITALAILKSEGKVTIVQEVEED